MVSRAMRRYSDAQEGSHPITLVIEQAGKVIKRIPLSVDVEKPAELPFWVSALPYQVLFFGAIGYGLYKLIQWARKKYQAMTEEQKHAWKTFFLVWTLVLIMFNVSGNAVRALLLIAAAYLVIKDIMKRSRHL